MRRLIQHVQATPTVWDDIALMFGLSLLVGFAAPVLVTCAALAITNL